MDTDAAKAKLIAGCYDAAIVSRDSGVPLSLALLVVVTEWAHVATIHGALSDEEIVDLGEQIGLAVIRAYSASRGPVS